MEGRKSLLSHKPVGSLGGDGGADTTTVTFAVAETTTPTSTRRNTAFAGPEAEEGGSPNRRQSLRDVRMTKISRSPLEEMREFFENSHREITAQHNVGSSRAEAHGRQGYLRDVHTYQLLGDSTNEDSRHQYMARKVLTHQLKQLWHEYDPTNIGQLTIEEAERFIAERFPEVNIKPAVSRSHRFADSVGYITLAEFMLMLRSLVYFKELVESHDIFNPMKNGKEQIKLSELRADRKLVNSLGLHSLSAAEMKRLFSKIEKAGSVDVVDLCSHLSRLRAVDDERRIALVSRHVKTHAAHGAFLRAGSTDELDRFAHDLMPAPAPVQMVSSEHGKSSAGRARSIALSKAGKGNVSDEKKGRLERFAQNLEKADAGGEGDDKEGEDDDAVAKTRHLTKPGSTRPGKLSKKKAWSSQAQGMAMTSARVQFTKPAQNDDILILGDRHFALREKIRKVTNLNEAKLDAMLNGQTRLEMFLDPHRDRTSPGDLKRENQKALLGWGQRKVTIALCVVLLRLLEETVFNRLYSVRRGVQEICVMNDHLSDTRREIKHHEFEEDTYTQASRILKMAFSAWASNAHHVRMLRADIARDRKRVQATAGTTTSAKTGGATAIASTTSTALVAATVTNGHHVMLSPAQSAHGHQGAIKDIDTYKLQRGLPMMCTSSHMQCRTTLLSQQQAEQRREMKQRVRQMALQQGGGVQAQAVASPAPLSNTTPPGRRPWSAVATSTPKASPTFAKLEDNGKPEDGDDITTIELNLKETLGVTLQENENTGVVYILGVQPDSQADMHGIEPGWQLLEVDGIDVATNDAVVARLETSRMLHTESGKSGPNPVRFVFSTKGVEVMPPSAGVPVAPPVHERRLPIETTTTEPQFLTMLDEAVRTYSSPRPNYRQQTPVRPPQTASGRTRDKYPARHHRLMVSGLPYS